jgi:ABC-type antimicrobial peptide transport system permease subunit
MLKNLLLVSLRSLLRYRTFSLMNVLGLTLGIACALFIFLLVRYERSYDQFHAKKDRIYRIVGGSPNSPIEQFDTGTPNGVATYVRAEIPEVELAGNVYKINPEQSQVEFNHELTRISHLFFAGPEFFEMTGFKWIQGSPRTSLGSPNQVVLSESVARKYLNGDAMGKTIRFNNTTDLIVSGILADPPLNTDFPFQVVMSYATLSGNKDFSGTDLQGWNSYYQTYILLKEGAKPETVDARLKQIIATHVGQKQAEKDLAFRVMPISDLHYIVGNFNDRTISQTTLNTLSIIGLFILGIAGINFTNLASAQAIRRSREVGIRKTLGSSRKFLVMQFLGETMLVVFAAIVLSYVLISQLVLLSYNLTEIPIGTEVLTAPVTFIYLASVLVALTLFSGTYPAFILSGFKPVEALKSAHPASPFGGLMFRKGLIAFQFIISQVLLIATLVVIKQVDHFTSLPLGFNKDAVLTADVPNTQASTLSTLKNGLLQDPAIKDVTFSLNTPSATINKWWAGLGHKSFGEEQHSAEVKLVDSVYFRMFEIKLIAGTSRLPYDSGKSVVVTRDLAKTIGSTDPAKAIGEHIMYWGKDATIVGVVEDFQTVSLHEGLHPVIMAYNPSMFQKMSLKIDLTQASSAIGHLEKSWKAAFPEYYFTYSFLDKDLQTFYSEERKISRLLITFASVAISIGCIGLFGLILFTSVQRTKEIGIRKILGATISGIVNLLSKEFIVLVLIAGVIAWPIAWFAMNSWLDGFEHKINLFANGWIFIVSTCVAAAFAMITTGIQAIKAAMRNPTEALRSE